MDRAGAPRMRPPPVRTVDLGRTRDARREQPERTDGRRARSPQTSTLELGGPAAAAVKESIVTLPPGVLLSPSAATGLEACSTGLVGFHRVRNVRTRVANRYVHLPFAGTGGNRVELLSRTARRSEVRAHPHPGSSERTRRRRLPRPAERKSVWLALRDVHRRPGSDFEGARKARRRSQPQPRYWSDHHELQEHASVAV